jgi:outer membrane receptor protein involved in Fe transport
MSKASLRFLAALLLYVTTTLAQTNLSSSHSDSDATSATRGLSTGLLRALPFRGGATDYYGLFSGVVVQDYRGADLVHIRGSRHDEIAYSFEGANLRSAYSGASLFRFIPEMLARLEAVSSPSAAHSHAAGLLHHAMRAPGNKLAFNLRGESDGFTSDYTKRLNTFSYGYSNLLGIAEGRLAFDRVRFLAGFERETFADHYRRFWPGFRFGKAGEEPLRDPVEGYTLAEHIGVEELVVKPGNVPEAGAERYIANAMLLADFAPLTLRALALFNHNQEQRNDLPIYNLFNPQRIPEAKQRASLFSLQADYQFNANFSAHAQFDVLRSSSKLYDPLFEDDFLLYLDSAAVVSKGVPWNDDPRQYHGSRPYYYFAFPFSKPGQLLADYRKQEENGLGFSAFLARKLGNHHVRLGGEWERRSIRRFVIEDLRGYLANIDNAALENEAAAQLQLLREGKMEALGYDYRGERISSDTELLNAPGEPRTLGLFAEDTWQWRELEIEAGLQFREFAAAALLLKDFARLDDFTPIPRSAFEISPSYRYLLPRLALAFEATPRLRLQAQYGKYAQQSALEEIYASPAYHSNLVHYSYYAAAPRALSAEPVRTEQMSAGFDLRLNANVQISATVFQRFTEGQMQIESIALASGAAGPQYNALHNSGEAATKGVELSASYARGGWHAWANLAWTDSRGFTSYSSTLWQDIYYQSVPDYAASPKRPLDYNQPLRANALVAYDFSIRAPAWLRKTSAALLYRMNNGHHHALFQTGDAFG